MGYRFSEILNLLKNQQFDFCHSYLKGVKQSI